MLGTIFTVFLVLVVLYVVLWSLRDNAAIAPIFNAIDPVVKGFWTSIKNGFTKLAEMFKKKDSSQ